MRNEIRVYGREGCEDTRNVVEYLDSQGLSYNYVDLDRSEDAEEQVKRHNDGRRVTPTLELISDGKTRVLSNPGIEELADAIENAGLNDKGAVAESSDTGDEWRKAS